MANFIWNLSSKISQLETLKLHEVLVYNLFSVVGEFDHCGPYSLLIRRLKLGPSEVKVFFLFILIFLRKTRLNYKGSKN